ncbi:MAG: nucleoside phosphorylase [Bacteroidia bacterium]
MKTIPDTELILNADGSVFHLHLFPGELAGTVILVGDPGRVAQISAHFDAIEVRKQNREFVTHTGICRGKRITAISTGIGTDNVDIVMNELDALVNIDFEARHARTELQSLNIIRIGTCGALQPEIHPGSGIISRYSVGLDNLLQFYKYEYHTDEQTLHEELRHHLFLMNYELPFYLFSGSVSLAKKFNEEMVEGITVTCPGFYGPQGRSLRLPARYGNLLSHLGRFRSGNFAITNFEMETSAIYGLSRLLGHHCITLDMVLANRATHEFSKNPKQQMEDFIEKVLEKL